MRNSGLGPVSRKSRELFGYDNDDNEFGYDNDDDDDDDDVSDFCISDETSKWSLHLY